MRLRGVGRHCIWGSLLRLLLELLTPPFVNLSSIICHLSFVMRSAGDRLHAVRAIPLNSKAKDEFTSNELTKPLDTKFAVLRLFEYSLDFLLQ
jgi:hypothetical protein